MTLKEQSAEAFAALRARDEEIIAEHGFIDPYGRDNWAYAKAKEADPEHQRLHAAFAVARAAYEASLRQKVADA